MNALFIILTIIAAIASILLTIVVLLQNGKGGGLASNFTAGNQTFGVRQTADILEKITWGLIVIIFVVCIISAFTLGTSNKDREDITTDIENQAGEVVPEFETPGETVTVPAEE